MNLHPNQLLVNMSSSTVVLTPHTVNGILVPDFVKQEEVDKMKDLQLFPDDVWVATYPKSGTVWTSQIVRLIRNLGEKDERILPADVMWLEEKECMKCKAEKT